MLPPRSIKYFGWRVKLMALGGGTYYGWDPVKEKLVPANTYQYYTMCCQPAGGMFYVLLHLIQIYLKLSRSDDIPDEALDSDQSNSGVAAPLIIGCGEVLLVTCIVFLNIVHLRRISVHMYLINQLIIYNRELGFMISSGRLTLSPRHKLMIGLSEYLSYGVMLISLFLPLGIWGATMHPVEPTHIIMKEWLDMEIGLNLDSWPVVVIILFQCYLCGTTINLMTQSISMFFILSTVMMDAMTPEEATALPAKRCRLVTRNCGILEDAELVHLYRTQQMLNLLLNEFYKSVLISYHHVGVLAATICLICFAIKHHDVLSREGVVAYLIVFVCIASCLTLIFSQSKMAGEVVDASNGFRARGRKMTGRGMGFHKFCRSCQTFYIQVAWPFYTVHKETFLLFIEQVLDYVIEMLLW